MHSLDGPAGALPIQPLSVGGGLPHLAQLRSAVKGNSGVVTAIHTMRAQCRAGATPALRTGSSTRASLT
eukprot:5990362-Pyramimonas_sp.AAC.1